MNKSSIPHHNGKPTRFPKKAPKKLRMIQEFVVREDGTISISNWLYEQTQQFIPECRGLSPRNPRLIEMAVAFFKQQRAHVAEQKIQRKRMPRRPVGLVSIDNAMENALAHAGIRMVTQ